MDGILKNIIDVTMVLLTGAGTYMLIKAQHRKQVEKHEERHTETDARIDELESKFETQVLQCEKRFELNEQGQESRQEMIEFKLDIISRDVKEVKESIKGRV